MRAYFRSLPKWLRVITTIAIVWAILRLALQFYTMLDPSMSDQVAVDLKSAYLGAAENFTARQDLYATKIEAMEGLYLYSPAFVLFFIPFTWLPIQVAVLIYSILCVAAYVLLFCRWRRIFSLLNMPRAGQVLMMALPAWLVFSPFWDDLTYLNIYMIMALVGTLFIEGILTENVILSSAWLGLILAAKPQWAYAAVLPLLLGRYRFFLKMLLGAALASLVLAGAAMLATSPQYILAQYGDYFAFLARLGSIHPWRTMADGFLGYNHSIVQIGIFLGGTGAAGLSRLVKYVLLLPVVIATGWYLLHPARKPAVQAGTTALQLIFVLYLGTFLWLDVLWEISLAIVIYTYLLATSRSRVERSVVSVVFLPYALLDIWRVFCYLAGSPMINEAYFSWDFSAYVPVTMIVLLVFLFILLRRLWLEHKEQWIS
jgi:hypothetical protein